MFASYIIFISVLVYKFGPNRIIFHIIKSIYFYIVFYLLKLRKITISRRFLCPTTEFPSWAPVANIFGLTSSKPAVVVSKNNLSVICMVRAWSKWRARSHMSRHCGSHGMRWERPPCPWESGATLPRPRPCWGVEGSPPPSEKTARVTEYSQTALQLEMTTVARETERDEDLPLQYIANLLAFIYNSRRLL